MLRLVGAVHLIGVGLTVALPAAQREPTALHWIAAGAGILLLAGLWTPVAGALLAMVEVWISITDTGHMDVTHIWTHLLMAALGAALAMLGPGAWSVDARLFGRKRIEVRFPSGLAGKHP